MFQSEEQSEEVEKKSKEVEKKSKEVEEKSEEVKKAAQNLKNTYYETGYYKPDVSDADLKGLLNETNEEVLSLLHVAVRLDCRDAVEKFLDLGADPNIRGHNFPPPIFFARSITVIRMLIKNGADIHLEDEALFSFFQFVCTESNFKVLKFLLHCYPELIEKVKIIFCLDGSTESVMTGVLGMMNEQGLNTVED